MAVNTKISRVDFRINEKDKELLETAAKINHLSVAAYITSVVLKQAELDIKKNELLNVNAKDIELIMKLLDKSPDPNEELIKLMK